MLTLDDTQGMFLLLGAGILMAVCALTLENVIGRVSSLRDRCPPGPRRRSSIGIDPLWMAGSRASSVAYDMTETRRKRPSHGKYRRSVNSLPGNMTEQFVGVVKGRSPSIVTAPPIVFIESTHASMEDLDKGTSLESDGLSEEENTSQDSYRDRRSLSIFSWVSALAARLKTGRGSQPREAYVDVDSPTDTRNQSPESVSVANDRQIFTIELNGRALESNFENHGATSGNVESVFGSRQDIAIGDLTQREMVESTRLSFPELFDPFKKMKTEESSGDSNDQTTGNVEELQQISDIETVQSTGSQRTVTGMEVSTKEVYVSKSLEVPVVSVTEPPGINETSIAEAELPTKLHRRTSSNVKRTQTTESQKKLSVPRTHNRPK